VVSVRSVGPEKHHTSAGSYPVVWECWVTRKDKGRVQTATKERNRILRELLKFYVKYFKSFETYNPKTNSQIGAIVNYVLFYLITFLPVITLHYNFVKDTHKVLLMLDMKVCIYIYIHMYVCIYIYIYIVPLTLNIDTRWRWVSKFTRPSLCPLGKNPSTNWIGEWVGLWNVLGFLERTEGLPLTGIEVILLQIYFLQVFLAVICLLLLLLLSSSSLLLPLGHI
jgi:hypothetical protein